MAVYRQVHISFWQDPYVEDLSPKEKYFYMYLMTNSKTKQCGCYEISMRLVKYETGLTQTEIDSYIKKLSKGNKIRYNAENQEFLLINWLKHNSFKSPKVLKCIKNETESVKTSIFRDYINSFVDSNNPIDSLSILYGESIYTGPQKEEEEEEEEEEQEKGRFTPPTLEEVQTYCKERNNKVDAQRWLDFYESKGWMIGKNKMKDWKAAVRTWESKDGKQSKPQDNIAEIMARKRENEW